MDQLEAFVTHARALSPAQWCRAFYILSAAGIAGLQLLPGDMSKALLAYGARRPRDGDRTGQKQARRKGFLDHLTSYGQVPHSWFLHYYVASVALSVFWAWQYTRGGPIMRGLAEMQSRSVDGRSSPSVDLSCTMVTSVLMCLQGMRRLYESLFVTKSGSTPMWVVHWALGLAYYTSISVSIWIQGSDAILQSWKATPTAQLHTPRIMFGAFIFFLASIHQHRCHKYLASLEKYTLPNKHLFRFIICPHYTFECLLYLSLAFIAAPPGAIFNKTLVCGLAFVAANLGVTAHGTKQWYAVKFGADKVAGKWKMIPFVF